MSDNYKVAIVTGASSGIGASIAQQLAMRGTTVYALARNKKNLESVRAQLRGSSRKRFIILACDISKRLQTQKIISKIYESTEVDLVICNAGVGQGKRLEDHSWMDVDRIIETNLIGTINVLKICLSFKNVYPTQFVCTTSLAGKIGFPELSVYSATKFALEGLVESLRNEYDPKEVAFTILRPGITGTAFFEKAGMTEFEESVKNLKSFYSPDKVATIFLSQLTRRSTVITIGKDKYYLALLPMIPFKSRFKVLDLINKI